MVNYLGYLYGRNHLFYYPTKIQNISETSKYPVIKIVKKSILNRPPLSLRIIAKYLEVSE